MLCVDGYWWLVDGHHCVEGWKLMVDWLPKPASLMPHRVVLRFANRGARRSEVGGWVSNEG